MRKAIVQQFKRPSGALGRLAGWIMAHRESNLRRNAWAVSLLHIEPQHLVLEIGSGPGVALEHATRLATRGTVVGVDHSELMVSVAAKRNAEAIAEGRLEVIRGTAEAAVKGRGRFDRVYAVNVAQFWDAPAATLAALRTAMAPNGLIGIAFQPRNRGATDEDAERAAQRYEQLLGEAGFADLWVERLALCPRAICVLGRAADSQLESGRT
ncbi:MAG: class I SAM-dependent methyltransferase [Polyangiales bacterium]